ncbi:MAG TPA: ABC transporter substrate-binding protein, partial [Cyanobacteria bacterium UBA8543]|nr:ABC transporter substrate-binding protein [Cyanobacteria bacterium UBA8543]
GGANAFAADQSVLAGWVQEYPQYRLLPVKLSTEALCIVMPKGLQYTNLQDRVNQAIARWQASGWLAERAAAWGLP